MPNYLNNSNLISLNDAARITKRYRDTVPVENGQYTEAIGLAFNKSDMKDLLDQEDCAGFRIYFALDDNNKKQLVITAIDSSGNDIYDGVLLDFGTPCPPDCGSSNPLNTNQT